jgi:AcrR family transcriptional regulator
VAFKLFAEKGIGFSLSEVSSEVGIQKASIYAHFASKEELLYAIINQEINEYFLEINEHCHDLKTLFFMIINYYDKSQTKLLFWKRLLLLSPKEFDESLIAKIHSLSDERLQIVKEIIRANMDQGTLRRQDPETVAISYMALVHGMLSSMIIYQSENISAYLAKVWENFWEGIS